MRRDREVGVRARRFSSLLLSFASLDGEAARLLDSLSEFLVHLLKGRVRGQIQSIEAGVRLGQVLLRCVD